jgi:hypothetical protein
MLGESQRNHPGKVSELLGNYRPMQKFVRFSMSRHADSGDARSESKLKGASVLHAYARDAKLINLLGRGGLESHRAREVIAELPEQ